MTYYISTICIVALASLLVTLVLKLAQLIYIHNQNRAKIKILKTKPDPLTQLNPIAQHEHTKELIYLEHELKSDITNIIILTCTIIGLATLLYYCCIQA